MKMPPSDTFAFMLPKQSGGRYFSRNHCVGVTSHEVLRPCCIICNTNGNSIGSVRGWDLWMWVCMEAFRRGVAEIVPAGISDIGILASMPRLRREKVNLEQV